MSRFIAIVLICVTSPPLLAANSLQDYAYQATVSDGAQPLQRLELPIEVILALTRSDFGDLAVFNRHGKPLPLSITSSPSQVTKQVLPLSFHEFNRYRRQHSKTVTTRERTQQPDSIAELETTETVAVQALLTDYLIELAADAKNREFQRIELQWEQEPANQILEVRIEVGDEIDSLAVFKARKSLTQRPSSDPSWTSISGLPNDKKYLRITPINDIKRFKLTQVHAHFRLEQDATPSQHRLKPTLIEENGQRFYHFDIPTAVQADAMRIIPGEPNSIVSGEVYAIWGRQKLARRILYSFHQHNFHESEIKPSTPIRLPQQVYKSIRFTSKSVLNRVPEVELIYPQYEVIFLGDGNNPYSLAWGSLYAAGPHYDLRGMIDGNLEQARKRSSLQSLGPTTTAGGLSRLAPEEEIPWEKWLLWSLLAQVVFITARMVFKLYREMKTASDS